MSRYCYWVSGSVHVEGEGWVPSVVVEGEPGHRPLVGDGSPWTWGPTLELARAVAKERNERLGLAPSDVEHILRSSVMAHES